jgi:hypothetical protein
MLPTWISAISINEGRNRKVRPTGKGMDLIAI